MMEIMTLYHFDAMEKQFDVKQQEAEDFKLLQKLNADIFKLENLERRIKKTDKDQIDASGRTSDNRIINIEIKSRDCNINTYPSLMIETHKKLPMLEEYIRYGRIPIYVNFLKDDKAVVFNVLIASGKMRRERTWSRLYKDWENGYKEYFPIDGNGVWIYEKKDEKWFKYKRDGK